MAELLFDPTIRNVFVVTCLVAVAVDFSNSRIRRWLSTRGQSDGTREMRVTRSCSTTHPDYQLRVATRTES